MSARLNAPGDTEREWREVGAAWKSESHRHKEGYGVSQFNKMEIEMGSMS